MDVELPDGTTLKGIPDGTTKAEIAAKLKANGREVPAAWLAPKTAASEPDSALTSFAKSTGAGASKLVFGAEQLAGQAASKLGFTETGKKLSDQGSAAQSLVDQVMAPDRAAHPIASGAGELVGETAAAGPLGKALGTGYKGATAAGAAVGAAQPADDLQAHAKNALIGAAGGAAGKAVADVGAKVISKIISPVVKGPAKELMDAGVRLTPGQMAGKTAKSLEEKASSAPVVGEAIKAAQGRAVQDYNIATINKALEPIGVKLPRGAQAGHEAIAAGQQALGDSYNKILPNLTFAMDQPFQAELRAIEQTSKELPPDLSKQFETFVNNRLKTRLSQTGVLDGEAYKQVQSEFAQEARKYRSDPGAAQRDLGATFGAVSDAMRGALLRLNPKYAPQLKAIDKSYAMFTRVEEAAARRATSDGVFTPSDFLQTIKSQEGGVRNKTFAGGNALLQDWARTGNKVLTNVVPNSGTTDRSLLIGGVGAAMHQPAVAAAGIGGGLLYSRPGIALANSYMNGNAAARASAAAKIQRDQKYKNIVKLLFPELATGGKPPQQAPQQ